MTHGSDTATLVTGTSRDRAENERSSPEYVHVSPEKFHVIVQQDYFEHWGEFNGNFYGLFKDHAPISSLTAQPSVRQKTTDKSSKSKKAKPVAEKVKEEVIARPAAGTIRVQFAEPSHAYGDSITSSAAGSRHGDHSSVVSNGSSFERGLSRMLTVRGARLLNQSDVSPAELPTIEAELKRLATLKRKATTMLRQKTLKPHEVPLLEAHLEQAEIERARLEDLDKKAREMELGPLPKGWHLQHTEDGEEYYVKFGVLYVLSICC